MILNLWSNSLCGLEEKLWDKEEKETVNWMCSVCWPWASPLSAAGVGFVNHEILSLHLEIDSPKTVIQELLLLLLLWDPFITSACQQFSQRNEFTKPRWVRSLKCVRGKRQGCGEAWLCEMVFLWCRLFADWNLWELRGLSRLDSQNKSRNCSGVED